MEHEPFKKRATSRKWIVWLVTVGSGIIVPGVYAFIGVSSEVTLAVLGLIGAASATYTGFNIMEKRK